MINQGKNNPMYGKTHTDEAKLKIKINNMGFKNPMYGKTHTDETKLKIKMSVVKSMRSKSEIKSPMLGKRHTDETKKKISRANKFYKKHNKMTIETKLNLSLVSVGIIVKVYDNSNNLINELFSIKKAAKFFKVSINFIRKYINSNKKFKGFVLTSEIKNNKIGIYNQDNKLIEILDNPMKISKFYNIPKTTIYRYIKTNKLYKSKYYFYKIIN
jgi:hypothetical protein